MKRKTVHFDESRTQAISAAKRRVFTLIVLAIPIISLLIVELLLRQFEYGGNLDLVIK
ncbi:MAG: hypothetical protein HY708_06855, partial [Ignavibacteriae bacterium]|nr:hypothetical protein [Ignavibacteriota bacterium]